MNMVLIGPAYPLRVSPTVNPLIGAWHDVSELGFAAFWKIVRLKARKRNQARKLRREILRSKDPLSDFGFRDRGSSEETENRSRSSSLPQTGVGQRSGFP